MEAWFWILGWVLTILTITGNGFIIFLVSSKRQLRTKTNAFVLSLAVADFCVGMSVVPSLFFCNITNGCNWPQAWLSWVHLMRWLFGYASVTNLCSLVLDRYIAVVKPLNYLTFMTRRRVIEMISVSWAIPLAFEILPIASLIYSTPILFYIFLWFLMIFYEFLPCFMLIVFFSSMLHFVYKHDRADRILAKQLRFNHRVSMFTSQEKSAVKMMAIVIGLFLLCYAIFLRCTFVSIVDVQNQCNDLEYKIPILVLNSAVNPLAYAFFKRDIKKEFKKTKLHGNLKRALSFKVDAILLFTQTIPDILAR